MRVLFIGAHCDDIEIGAGATLHRMSSRLWNVSVAVMSMRSLLIGTDLRPHVRASLADLGVAQCSFFDFPDGSMESHRQGVYEAIRSLKASSWFDLVVCPSLDDHQDHCTVHREVVRNFQGSSLISYCIQRSDQQFAPSCFFEVSEDDLAAKVAALSHYPAELRLKSYFRPELIRAQAVVYGEYTGMPLAEGFRVTRWVQRV